MENNTNSRTDEFMSHYNMVAWDEYRRKNKQTMTFKNHYNAKPSLGEKNDQPSQTIPDQTLSIKEIMRRYASGLPIEGERVPIYEGEEDPYPEIARMDLAEREQFKRELENELKEVNNRLKSYDEEKVKKAKKAEEERLKGKKEHIEEAEVIEPEQKPKTKSTK